VQSRYGETGRSSRPEQALNRRTIDLPVCLPHDQSMQAATKAGVRPPRARVSQPVRVRPFDSHYPEEVSVTRNVSRKGLYFETALGHYFSGMEVYVTRNFHPHDPMSHDEAGDVVRVEKLRTGKWGVAIRIVASSNRSAW